MTMTIPTGSRIFHTPPRWRQDLVALPDEPASGVDSWEPTPVNVTRTTPALRDLFELFASSLDPVTELDRVRFVHSADGDATDFVAFSQASVTFIQLKESSSVVGAFSDVIQTFERLQVELGVTQRDLFRATGIKHRTFHSWAKKSTDSRPRLSSVGQLWLLADAVDDLRESVEGSVNKWIHAKPDRLEMLRAGRFDDLVNAAVVGSRAGSLSAARSTYTGLAPDVELPVVKSDDRPASVKVRQSARP